MRVEIRGTVYETVKAAAAAIGVKPATVYSAICNGTTETVGNGPGKYPRTPKTKELSSASNMRAVTLGSITFKSIRHAEDELGYAHGSIARVLRSGKQRSQSRLRRAVKEYKEKHRRRLRRSNLKAAQCSKQ